MAAEKIFPMLPKDPTGNDRVVYALALLEYYEKSVFSLCIIRIHAEARYKVSSIHPEDDKLKMVKRAKAILKAEKYAAKVDNNIILAGCALVVKHNGSCIAVIILDEPITVEMITELKLPVSFLPVKETYSGSGTKGNLTSTKKNEIKEPPGKQDRKAYRYLRKGNLVS